MGLFDWLFGKKKDPYGGRSLDRDYESAQSPHKTRPQARGGPVPLPTGYDALKETGLRGKNLSFRRKRSREHVGPRPDLTLEGTANPMTGQASAVGPIGNFGGTARHPDIGYDPSMARGLGLPELAHFDQLAELLQTPRNQLLWLCAKPVLPGRTDAHYTLRVIPKKSGGRRMLMVPLPILKRVQSLLLERLVNNLPLHESAHGFRKERDILSGASVHVGREVVIGLDIHDFFPSFTFRRVSGYFRSRGYGRGISVALGNLTTNMPGDAFVKVGRKWQPPSWDEFPELSSYWHPILPQGAPTSPGIANAICWRMDKRLSALARKFGGDYTRYADDLTFSGHADMARNAEKLVKIVREIVKTEGLALNEKKTRIMRKGRQQRVTGVVVNEKTNVSRREYDQLKAILHNCVKHGPDSQNRDGHEDWEGHLRGRIAHVSHIGPERGAKLQRVFEQIRW